MTRCRLSIQDRAFLAFDSATISAHVAALAVFDLPPTAAPDHVTSIVSQMRSANTFASPWNLRLAHPRLRKVAPSWDVVDDADIDLDYHLRHSALPGTGDQAALGRLVSRLHSRPLDPSRPLWEVHVIENLEENRFAIYLKVHHALMDGESGARRLTGMLSVSPDDRQVRAAWTPGSEARASRRRSPSGDPSSRPASSARQSLSVARELVGATGRMVREAKRPSDPDRGLPFSAPATPRLNGRVSRQRRVATQSFDFDRIRAVATWADVTINDVFLAVVAGGLRSYLHELRELPDASLVGGAPVSVRTDDDSGNAIAFLMVKLGTQIANPLERLVAINRSSAVAKADLARLSPAAISQHAALVNGPFIAQCLLGVGGRMRPPYNLVVSNVPGPREPRYLGGGRLRELYPLSVVLEGQALNVVVMTTSDRFNIGFVGCRDRLPHLQRLAVHTGDALSALEAAAAGDARTLAGDRA